MGRAFTYRCAACAIDLDDGVEYVECPRCSGAIQWVDRTPSPRVSSSLPSLARMTTGVAVLAIVVQTIFAVVDPYAFPYLRPVLVIVQLAAVPGALAAIAFVPAMRALLDARTRALHGLEHATIAVLAERGITVYRGVTLTGLFDLDVPATGGATVEQVRDATSAAIRRVAAGERALVYTEHCGTSAIVGWLVIAIAVAAAGGFALGHDAPPGYAFAATVAAIAIARAMSRRLGLWAQRALTVSAHFASARVGAVEREVSPRGDIVHFAVHIDVEPIRGAAIAEPV